MSPAPASWIRSHQAWGDRTQGGTTPGLVSLPSPPQRLRVNCTILEAWLDIRLSSAPREFSPLRKAA
jgi:hypothetical protein